MPLKCGHHAGELNIEWVLYQIRPDGVKLGLLSVCGWESIILTFSVHITRSASLQSDKVSPPDIQQEERSHTGEQIKSGVTGHIDKKRV